MEHIKQGFSLKAWVQSPGWTLGLRRRPKIYFSEHGCLAYQIKGNER